MEAENYTRSEAKNGFVWATIEGLGKTGDSVAVFPATAKSFNDPATDAPFLNMIFVAPVTWLGGPVAAYNLLVFLSHFLSGFFAYLWISRVTGRPRCSRTRRTSRFLPSWRDRVSQAFDPCSRSSAARIGP